MFVLAGAVRSGRNGKDGLALLQHRLYGQRVCDGFRTGGEGRHGDGVPLPLPLQVQGQDGHGVHQPHGFRPRPLPGGGGKEAQPLAACQGGAWRLCHSRSDDYGADCLRQDGIQAEEVGTSLFGGFRG